MKSFSQAEGMEGLHNNLWGIVLIRELVVLAILKEGAKGVHPLKREWGETRFGPAILLFCSPLPVINKGP